jgi:hypothetical protein
MKRPRRQNARCASNPSKSERKAAIKVARNGYVEAATERLA